MKKVKRKRKRKLKRLASPKAKMIMKRFHSILYFDVLILPFLYL